MTNPQLEAKLEGMTTEELENIAEQQMEAMNESYGSPEPERKDSVFKFFEKILKLAESWKVGNLHDTEIGQSKLSVRGNLEIAQYCKAEDLMEVSEYFTKRAEIIASTSMGRKGFLAQLFVTQIKKEQKLKPPMAQKKKLFGGYKEVPYGEQQ